MLREPKYVEAHVLPHAQNLIPQSLLLQDVYSDGGVGVGVGVGVVDVDDDCVVQLCVTVTCRTMWLHEALLLVLQV